MKFDLSALGRWTDEQSVEVTLPHTTAYAAATNDTNRRHVGGEVAPPMFAVVPALMGVMTKALWTVAVSDVSGYDTRSVHGEQDLYILRPIVPGMVLRSRAAPVGVHAKTSGTVVITKTETRDEQAELVNYQYWTNFMRGVLVPESVGEEAPARSLPTSVDRAEPVATVAYRVDVDQGARYAEASGDHGIYHLDDSAARAAGFPGVIVHGLCTMAFACRAVVERACEDDSRRLKRLAVRFTRPLLPGQDVVTSIWDAGEHEGVRVYAFEVADASGQLVIRHGLAEVAK